jgi:ribosomal protein S18 acetylase RimI-like enzyme
MLSFSKASVKDIALLRSLAREIWTTCYPGIITMEQIEYMLSLMYSAETIEREINTGIIWEVIRYNEDPVGFLAITLTPEGVVKLNKLYLKHTQHGKGFGQQSLDHVVSFARENEYKSIYLTVNKNNVKAIKAYEKNGFTRTESIISDIGNGYVMDDYIYSFSLI